MSSRRCPSFPLPPSPFPPSTLTASLYRVIGNFLSAIGVGIVLSLSVQYASSYGGRDKAIFQALVALMTVLAVADAGNLASWCYRWTVSAVMQPELLEELPVEATLYCFFTSVLQ